MTAPGHAAQADAKAPASAWYALGVLVLTTLFAFVDKQILALIAPSLQRSLGFSDLQLGALQGLGLAIFASLASYPFGWLADRFGRRLLLAIGATIWSLSTAACAFQSSFTGLFVATIGVAVGEAGLGPIVFALIPDLFPERQRNAANFTYFAAALLGAAIGLALGGLTLGWIESIHASLPLWLADLEAWRVALLMVAAPGPVIVLLILSIPIKSALAAGERPIVAPHEHMRFAPFARENWKTLAGILGAIAAYSFPLNSTFVWLPVAMPRIFGTEPATVGLQMGVAVGMGTIFGLLLPAIGSKLVPNASPLRSLTLARFFVLTATAPTVALSLPLGQIAIYAAAGAQLMLALATAALMPGILQSISPDALRARILAFLGIVGGVATGLSPLLVGALSTVLEGPRGIMTALVLVGVPGWLASFVLLTLVRTPYMTTIRAREGAPSIADDAGTYFRAAS